MNILRYILRLSCVTFLFLTLLYLPANVLAQHEGHEMGNKVLEHASHGLKKTKSISGTIWTCSMHPQIKMNKPGKCPLCHMDLIPVETEPEEDGSEHAGPSLKMSETAKMLAELETSLVERKWVSREVSLVGKVDYDETRVKHITAWVPGRVDRLYVDYTGISVKEGDHMVYLYSPELLSAQEELIQSVRSLSRLGGEASSLVKKSSRRSAEAAREKLRLLGLTDAQVKEIEKRGTADEHMTIFAPMGGVVVEKYINEGMYVKTGGRIYTIADLSHLWVYLDAYESDLPWIKYGQKVSFKAEAFPGEKFEGVVSFVHPFLDEKTRTVRVRVNVENKGSRLKPGLFVTGAVNAKITAKGEVLSPTLAGQYICPMHPEVVREDSGDCPICGMNLVEASSLPFVSDVDVDDAKPPLVVPASATLVTGKRAIVYVKKPDESRYEGRHVVLGPRAGDYYIVKEGLKEGEVVVTNGAFKIDADLQIQGNRSMMNPEGIKQSTGHDHGSGTSPKKEESNSHKEHKQPVASKKDALPNELTPVLDAYLDYSEALASDSLEEVKKAFVNLKQLSKDEKLVELFESYTDGLKDISEARSVFGSISAILIPAFQNYTLPKDLAVSKAHCPMALDGKGAFWLQRGEVVRNPYFGTSMLACGSIEESF